jgi:stage II sporulation protein D
VNWIGLENYLLGVVPSELGPEIWPQLEALKAQAVAARTYAWRNLGQFDEDGYDLCATPRCQVYGGAAAEHPLSDRAVASTSGEFLAWEGKPISALYTATCGGHTEDAAEIFPEERAPYLVGVPCRAEGEAAAVVFTELSGRTIAPVIGETGEDFTRDWSLLAAAGVLPEGADPGAPLGAEDLRAWTSALARKAGRPLPAAAGGTATVADAATALVEAIGWSERARLLMSEADPRAVLRDPESQALPEAQRRALACLVAQGAIAPFPGGALGVTRAMSRARAAAVLARAGDTYEALGTREAVLGGVAAGALRLVQGRGEVTLPLAEHPYLFSFVAGRTVPAARLALWSGDRVRFRTDDRGRIDFLELRPPVKGVADDRSAKVFSWELRQSRREVEEAVNRRVDIGTLRDLEIVRRGKSGRILELKVTGDRGATVVKGFDVRTLLGLRDSLAVIEIQRDGSGAIEAVVFAGKGWGHGVGLCQVGAYGMALRGSTYREILTHYYRGAALSRIPAGGR